MSARAARILFAAFFLAYTLALTYPGLLPFNRTRPFVLGLPFTLAWVAIWVIAGFGVFLLIDHVLSREDHASAERTERR